MYAEHVYIEGNGLEGDHDFKIGGNNLHCADAITLASENTKDLQTPVMKVKEHVKKGAKITYQEGQTNNRYSNQS